VVFIKKILQYGFGYIFFVEILFSKKDICTVELKNFDNSAALPDLKASEMPEGIFVCSCDDAANVRTNSRAAGIYLFLTITFSLISGNILQLDYCKINQFQLR
jgi:hypothetical protein